MNIHNTINMTKSKRIFKVFKNWHDLILNVKRVYLHLVESVVCKATKAFTHLWSERVAFSGQFVRGIFLTSQIQLERVMK